MSTATLEARPAWENRWATPTVDQLIEPYAKIDELVDVDLNKFLESIEGLDQVETTLQWFGTGWNWTLQYTIHDTSGDEIDTLCYVVPNLTGPVLSVPLQDQMILQLPIRRLTKYVREGIRSAKQAVKINWASWLPNSNADLDQLFELVRFKHKYTLNPKEPGKRRTVKSKA